MEVEFVDSRSFCGKIVCVLAMITVILDGGNGRIQVFAIHLAG